MKPSIVIMLIVCTFVASIFAGDTTTQNKNITVINAQSTADGKSEVGERLLEECVVGLPVAQDLEPVISSASSFLKEINGDAGKNDFVKTYSAVIEINYMIYQKVLLVVTTNSVTAQEPVMKVMEKKIQQVKRFTSDPSNGDLYAGRSHREYYYSTEQGAKNDVLKKAQVWLKQQAAVVCKPQQK